MNCISCKDNFYKINGTDNCFDETLLSKGFYLKNFLFYQCDDNCLTCSDEKMKNLIIVYLVIMKLEVYIY